MRLEAKTMVARAVDTITRSQAPLACWLRRLIEARRRRIEHEREFYRKLKAYSRANNVSPICEDDWKTAAYDQER